MKITPRSRIFKAAAAVCMIALIAMTATLLLQERPPEFVPPPFDAGAVEGIPQPDEGLGWAEIWQDGMSYRAWICGRFAPKEDGAADVYLYNVPENEVWLKLRVMDGQGAVIGETGLIRPGEYVQSVVLSAVPEPGAEVTMKIMSYEPESYRSMGAVSVTSQVSAE